MPGSTTTPGCRRSCNNDRLHLAFHVDHSVGARKEIFEAQWPACACTCRRFAGVLTGAAARLGVDMTRYVFIVRDFHSIFLAGLPAHGQFYSGANSARLESRQMHPIPTSFCTPRVSAIVDSARPKTTLRSRTTEARKPLLTGLFAWYNSGPSWGRTTDLMLIKHAL